MSLRSTATQPSSVSGAGGASTSSAPRPRQSASVASKPAATSASSSPSREEIPSRSPASGRGSTGPPAPAIPARSSAQSSTVRAIGPAWSRLSASGTIPRIGTSPRVGLIVEVPQNAEGIRSEPAVSVPVAAGVIRAASAAPEPPLEPPAERSSAHGLPTWSVVPPAANSCVCRWPSSTIPSASSRSHASQERSGTSSRRRLDAVSGFPATA